MATATLSFFPTTTTRTNFKQFSPLFSKTNPTSFNPNISISSNTFLFTPPKHTFLSITKSSESEAPVIEAEFEPETALTQIAETSEEETPKPEQIFAVVMIGSRQYIVFPGRFLVTQRLKGANVNDKIILNKVLLVGTKTTTYIGQPVVTNAVVHAVVEDVGLNPKVIVFKYKKRKHYKRNIGHRQPNTRIRITGITGYQDYPADTLESAKEHAQKALRERELARAS